MGNPDPLLIADLAAVDLHLSRDHFHERGLPRAVAAEQRHALAGLDLEADVVEEKGPAEGEGDFLLVARVEASSKASADHCLPDRNSAGLALRPSSGDAAWLTWTVEPYIWDHGATKAACEEDADDTNNPTARLRLRTPAQEAPTVDDVGLDGEADIGLCRVGSEVFHYFRSPTQDLTTDGWSSGGASAATMPGVLDLGLTATGSGAEYQAAGHFNWVVFERGTWGDGCAAALERFQLPEADPK